MRGLRGREAGLTAVSGAVRLHRDRLTWTMYGWLATWAWFLFAFGPAIPLLRAEQGTSRSVSALHGTMLAAGAVLAGLLTGGLTRRVGRRAVIIGGAAVVAAGIVLLVSGGGIAATLAGALLVGTGGSSALNATTPTLAEHHGPAGAASISEGNGAGALVGVAAPLALGAAVAAGLGWRPAIAVTAVLAVAFIIALRRVPAEPALGAGPAPQPRAERPPLGGTFWLVLGVLAAGVGVEFATTFWAGDLLQVRLGARPGAAAAAVTGFVFGMALGRYVAGRLALRLEVPRLLLAALVTAVAGWAVLWVAPGMPLAVLGLVVCGTGVAGLFPLGVSLLMTASGGRPDVATAAASMAAGVAIAAAPFGLGALADWVGPHLGFLLVPAVLVTGGVLLLASGTLRRPRPAASGPTPG